jgi:hypothetical protein
MKCFYDFEYITRCINCNSEFFGHTCCDNSCGSFECEKCKKEFFAQYIDNLRLEQIKEIMKSQHKIIETKRGYIIIGIGHNEKCGDF